MKAPITNCIRVVELFLFVIRFVLGIEHVYHSTFTYPTNDVINDTFVKHEVTPMNMCIDKCKLEKGCQYVNYHVKPHVCYLYNYQGHNVFSSTLSPSPGYASSQKTDWNMSDYADCDQCTLSETCVRNPDGTTSCDIADCGLPPVLSLSTTFGNIYSTRSKIIYNCSGNDVIVNGENNTATCLSNGTWFGPFITCIDTSDGYTYVWLEDGTLFIYKLFMGGLKQNYADSACRNEGARLIAPLTVAKMNSMRTTLYGQYAGSDIDFFTDVRNDRSSVNIWETSTNEVLPMGSPFWAPGKPSSINDQRCVRFKSEDNYFIENTYCTNSLSYICEKSLYNI